MRIYLFLIDRVVSFVLPKEKFGSYAFDDNPEEDIKLINIEAVSEEWILHSTNDVQVYANNQPVDKVELLPKTYYVIRRDNTTYPIFVTEGFDDTFKLYKYSENLNIIIGNDDKCNIRFACPFFDGVVLNIQRNDERIVLKKSEKIRVFCNDVSINSEALYVNQGDKINLYGLNLIFFNGYVLINQPFDNMLFEANAAGLEGAPLVRIGEKQDLEVRDIDLYKPEDYFSKAPRLRRLIETKVFELSPPPDSAEEKSSSMLLTIGPMLTMAVTSLVMSVNTITGLVEGTTDIGTAWPRLAAALAMLLSMILWPNLSKRYEKKMAKNKKQELIEKYTEYLDIKRKELQEEKNLQKEIIIENVISVEECLNNINIGRLNFWSKRIEQNDFLNVRLGVGNELLDVQINYPEKGFSIDEDELRIEADKLVEEFKYIENVPVSYSFAKSKITAVMGLAYKQYGLMNNVILQLVSFYSYDDIKFVVFTNEKNEKRWDYLKYLNHTFSNQKDIRFFSTDYESAKKISDYLSQELQQRYVVPEETPTEGGDQKSENRLFKPHYIIITDDYNQIKGLSFIKNIVELDNSCGFSFVILENMLSKLPSKCNNFISLGEKTSGIMRNSFEQQEQQVFVDEIKYNINMYDVAKRISNIPIEFQEGNASLPDSVTFLEMEKVGKVEQLNILDRWNTNDSVQSLKAEVGIDAEGNLMYLDLHEKYHGPHGLIAGMTGSGKSEFIISYILSMAINYSPDDVAFILIDYKGGGLAFAFENKSTGVVVPHLAGTITNLDKAEMDRTLVSIDSEVKRRQQLFNEARDKLGESTIDIYKYQGFYHEGKLDEPLPHLFIICDEFAELKSQQPEFMDNLISVARIGRSLGVHLILATQKPSGVVNDQIWSNTKFRVCLKVQDASDSKEMLKRPEAASLKQAGRFYLQVGYDEYFALGQSGWCGAKYYPSEKIIKQVDKSINIINNTGEYIKSMQASGNNIKVEAQGEQLTAIMNSIIEVSNREKKKAKKLWLDNIPDYLFHDQLQQKYGFEPKKYDVSAIVGEYDAPEEQKQGLVEYNLKNCENTLIFGNDGEEREKLINSMLYSIVKNYSSEEVNIYIVDYGSESSRIFSEFPQVGGMAFAGEEEKFKNTFKLITNTISQRKKICVPYGGSFEEYNKNNEKKLPQVLFIINNYESFLEMYKTFSDTIVSVCRDCTRYGVYFMISLNLNSSLGRRASLCFNNRYAFHFTDNDEYVNIFDMKCKTIPRDILGRGICRVDGILHEFQTYSISDEEHTDSDVVKELLEKVKQTKMPLAPRVPELPERVTLDLVEKDIKNVLRIPIGINRNSLKTAYLDFSTFPFVCIASNRLTNIDNFILSFIEVIKKIPGLNIVFLDLQKLVPDVKNSLKNYYDSDFDGLIEKLIPVVEKEENKTKNYLYIFYGVEKLKTVLTGTTNLESLFDSIKKTDNNFVLMCDAAKSFKNLDYDSWYSKVRNNTDGLWVGKGFNDQTVLKVGKFTKEMEKKYPNNYGYLVSESSPELVKLIEFIESNETEEDEEEEETDEE